MDSDLTDPVIDEIRAIRHRISEECGHDPVRLVAYFKQIEEQHRDRVLGQSGEARASETATPAPDTKAPHDHGG